MRIVSLLLLLASAACANVSGNELQACGTTVTIYQNLDTTNTATFDFTVSFNPTGSCGGTLTITWTDGAGIQQTIVLKTDSPGYSSQVSRSVRATLPPAGSGTPAAITVTTDSGSQPASYGWQVERVS